MHVLDNRSNKALRSLVFLDGMTIPVQESFISREKPNLHDAERLEMKIKERKTL